MTATDPLQTFEIFARIRAREESKMQYIFLPDGMSLVKLWKPIAILLSLAAIGWLMNLLDYMDRYYLLFLLFGVYATVCAAVLGQMEVSKFLQSQQSDGQNESGQ